MLKRWILYLAAWTGCAVFFICYLQWFAWLCMVAVTLLPLVSLLLSLPAMLSARVHTDFPAAVTLGTPVSAKITVKTLLPCPGWKAKLAVGRELTQEGWALEPGAPMPTDHCGRLECSLVEVRVYDYLGLFSRKLKAPKPFDVTVRPAPVDSRQLPPMHPGRAIRWKPKRAGGYAENYELRLYRPGDSLQQIHWKLSGKTGKLLLREPMEPAQAPRLALHLSGSPSELDEKLGQLLYLAQTMLDQGVGFQILAYTGQGLFQRQVSDEAALWQSLDTLLSLRPAQGEEAFVGKIHYIGGHGHEKD